MKICGFEGCGRRDQNRGWCRRHRRQYDAGKPLRPLPPRVEPTIMAQIMEQVKTGLRQFEVAKKLKLPYKMVVNVCRRAENRETMKRVRFPPRPAPKRARRAQLDPYGANYKADLEAAAAGGPRCRCGLLLPCLDCTATNAVEHMAKMHVAGNLADAFGKKADT